MAVKMVRKFRGLHRAQLQELARVINSVIRRDESFDPSLRMFTGTQITELSSLAIQVNSTINDLVPKT